MDNVCDKEFDAVPTAIEFYEMGCTLQPGESFTVTVNGESVKMVVVEVDAYASCGDPGCCGYNKYTHFVKVA